LRQRYSVEVYGTNLSIDVRLVGVGDQLWQPEDPTVVPGTPRADSREHRQCGPARGQEETADSPTCYLLFDAGELFTIVKMVKAPNALSRTKSISHHSFRA
jgi:hypothetical protein